MSKMWFKLMCDSNRLQLKGTLNGGQSFRWKKQEKQIDKDEPTKDEWIGIFGGCLWTLIQETDHILYKVVDLGAEEDDKPVVKKVKVDSQQSSKYDKMLRDYFRLDVNLDKYYTEWSTADPYFEMAAKDFYGIRILAQEPVENIFSFICSSNNNISRISSMVNKMCDLYGSKIAEIDGKPYHAFPKVEDLADDGVEKALREAGFGYRAGYISKSAKKILELGGEDWINKLKKMDYADAKNNLIILTGIGAKVADCICLMSLNHLEAIPVDTHIYQIAKRCYLKHLAKQKTVTEKIYNEIGDHFRKLYGPYAGWAHTVLFCADLKAFQNTAKPEK